MVIKIRLFFYFNYLDGPTNRILIWFIIHRTSKQDYFNENKWQTNTLIHLNKTWRIYIFTSFKFECVEKKPLRLLGMPLKLTPPLCTRFGVLHSAWVGSFFPFVKAMGAYPTCPVLICIRLFYIFCDCLKLWGCRTGSMRLCTSIQSISYTHIFCVYSG